MKKTVYILLLTYLYLPVSAQYFFTGEVKDPHGDNLSNVAIFVQSTNMIYRTGAYGNFEIKSRQPEDSVTFSFFGYDQYKTTISSSNFLQVTLKRQPLPLSTDSNYLLSSINTPSGAHTSLPPSAPASPPSLAATPPTSLPPTALTSSSSLAENPFISQPSTVSFTGNNSMLSYSNVRRFLDMGLAVPPDAVKLEEILSYFNFSYEEPDAGQPLHCSSNLLSCPWNNNHRLLCLNICARKANIPTVPPANLVFLVDVSGSMDLPNKLPLVQSAFRGLIRNLRDNDKVSIVEYGGNSNGWEGVPGSEKGAILNAIEQLKADGPSTGTAGFQMAYKIAQRQFVADGNNRIILITDGDAAGKDAEKDLETLVEEQNAAGIHLSCMAVGIDEGDSSELSLLAHEGHGDYAAIKEEKGGEKWLLDELAHTPLDIAEKVCITTSFDTTLVGEYRLLGFDNKRKALEDTSLRLEGCNISSAGSILAFFELVPKKDSAGIPTVAEVNIKYQLPGQAGEKKMSYQCPNQPIPFDRLDPGLRKAACIALFSMKLKGTGYPTQMSWADLERLAKKNFSPNNYVDRQYLGFLAKARKIYEH